MAEMEIPLLDISSFCSDVVAASVSYAFCISFMIFFERIYQKGLLDMYLRGKLCHISMGLSVMLSWPMFRHTISGRVIAGLIPGFCLITRLASQTKRVDMSARFVDKYKGPSHLLIAAVSYGLTIAFATVFYWGSPISIAAICNLCAGDGVADIAGRRLGSRKLPYNKNKSFAGSISMAIAGFLTSIIFMYYFSWWGWNIEESPNTVLGFLITSIISAVVESHPLSSTFEDNLTVPVASILVGIFLL